MIKIKKLINELLDVTESAAISCQVWHGTGKKNEADEAAVGEMRNLLNQIDFDAKVVIGEGERDKAPMLFIGERLGIKANNSNENSKSQFDLAVDPLEGTNLCANFKSDAMTVLAITEAGGFLNSPDVYMEKIAVPEQVAHGVVSLKNSAIVNLNNIIDDLDCSASDLLVTVLERPRHEKLVSEIRSVGARVKLIPDGDVNAVISTALGDTDYLNIYMGIGGAPEGVLAAAALRSLGGYIEGKLIFDNAQKERVQSNMNILNFNKIYSLNEMVSKECAFIATGVTAGMYLDGVHVEDGRVSTHSMILTSWDQGISYVERMRNL